MGKYLTRETVVYRFKHWMMPLFEFEPTIENLTAAWKLFLAENVKSGHISVKQADKWRFPKKELNL